MKRMLSVLLAIVFLTGCGPSVQYLGKSYSPTGNVEVFYDTRDVKKDYEVMGKIDGMAGILENSYQEIQDKIVKEAQSRGADAVLIYNMEQRVIGNTSNSSTTVNTQAEHRQWYDKLLSGSSTVATTSTVSSNVTQNTLHADFLKYK